MNLTSVHVVVSGPHGDGQFGWTLTTFAGGRTPMVAESGRAPSELAAREEAATVGRQALAQLGKAP